MELFSFGPWLMRCRCAFLPECRAARHALALGDGDGRFTARLLSANPALHIDAVDASKAMLQALVRRAGPHPTRVHPIHADLRAWKPANLPYDLIYSHFLLDCLTTNEIQTLAVDLANSVSPTAQLIVAEFAVPNNWFGKLAAYPLVSLLYRVFGWLAGLQLRRLPDHTSALRQAGFNLQKRKLWLGGLLVSELWSLSHSS